jgi:rhodanese-related sulfurtransferase
MTAGHSERFVALVEGAKKHIRELDAGEVHSRLEKKESFHLVDVREDREWAASRIPGAIHIGRGVLERDVEKVIPDLDAEIVLYCGGGYRSALAAESLTRMGYRRVRSMGGGFRGWKDGGRPIDEAPEGSQVKK